MDRRGFLVSGGVAALGASVLGCERAAKPAAPAAGLVAALPSAASSWADIKAEFSLDPALAHLAGFFLASHPRVVREAIERHRREFDANPIEYLENRAGEFERAARAAASEYLACGPDDLAFTDSTTMGLGTLYGGMRLAPGQEILSTTHDHIVTTLSCQFRAERGGATFRQVPIYDAPATASAAAIVDRVAAAIRPETRILAITWVHSGTGVKLPIRAICDRVAALNTARAAGSRVLVCVDGVHGFGIETATPGELGCDFFVAGCHKWLFGPRGTGLVWGKREAWAETTPTIPSFDPLWRQGDPMHIPQPGVMTPGGFHSYEHRWAVEQAFRFHLALGKPRIAARIHELNRHIKQELARMSHVHVMTPMADELSAGITCFLVDGIAPKSAVERLRAAKVVASVTPGFYTPEYVRLSAGLINVEADVERALSAVRALS